MNINYNIVYELFASKKPDVILKRYGRNMSPENYLEKLSQMYQYIKNITNQYYLGNGVMHSSYNFFLQYILKYEEYFKSAKLLDVSLDSCGLTKCDFLEELASKTRNYLVRTYMNDGIFKNVQDYDYSRKCHLASSFIKDYCSCFGVENYSLRIFPGYDASARLNNGDGYHFSNIVKSDNDYYLIDITYSQFFDKVNGNLDRLGIVNLNGCNLGCFVMMDERRIEVAKELLKKGYIKLDDNVFKTYLDSFTISFRNGLYYEKTGDFSFSADYSVDDYVNFLFFKDSQIAHEGKENLGYQKKPLKDCHLNFRKR